MASSMAATYTRAAKFLQDLEKHEVLLDLIMKLDAEEEAAVTSFIANLLLIRAGRASTAQHQS